MAKFCFYSLYYKPHRLCHLVPARYFHSSYVQYLAVWAQNLLLASVNQPVKLTVTDFQHFCNCQWEDLLINIWDIQGRLRMCFYSVYSQLIASIICLSQVTRWFLCYVILWVKLEKNATHKAKGKNNTSIWALVGQDETLLDDKLI